MSLHAKLDKLAAKTGGESSGIQLMSFDNGHTMFDQSGQVEVKGWRKLPSGRVQLESGEVCAPPCVFSALPFRPAECPEAAEPRERGPYYAD